MDQLEKLIEDLGRLYKGFSDVFATLENLKEANEDSFVRYEQYLVGLVRQKENIIKALQEEKKKYAN